jgi:hypothetical protein
MTWMGTRILWSIPHGADGRSVGGLWDHHDRTMRA